MNKTIIVVVVLVILGVAGYFLFMNKPKTVTPEPAAPVATSTTAENEPQTVIGTSVNGAPIIAYHYGTGSREILFVGGIHGGYEWNTSAVAYQMMDWLASNPTEIPADSDLKVTVIPVVNPDGLKKVVSKDGPFTVNDIDLKADPVAARFNANNVDLNRNFNCDWQATGTWQNKSVSGGTVAFSEPESQAIRDYVSSHNPLAVVVWYSSAGGVYSSNCHEGVLPETSTLTDIFAKASGYPAHDSFDYYSITGDMVNWLAKEGIPGISVLLTNHTDTEWTKNEAGVKAVIDHYAKQ